MVQHLIEAAMGASGDLAKVTGHNVAPALDDVFVIEEYGGKWFINPRALSQDKRNRGRPFSTREDAVVASRNISSQTIKDWYDELQISKGELEGDPIPRNDDVDEVADLNYPHESDPIAGEGHYKTSAGDTVSRVVWGVKRGQDIVPNSLSLIGVEGDNPNVSGLHVGDPDYWRKRLNKDYGRTGGRVVKIRIAEGDRLVTDRQYMTDPDTGYKADSAVLLTARKVLKYGRDWVFGGEDLKECSAPLRQGVTGNTCAGSTTAEAGRVGSSPTGASQVTQHLIEAAMNASGDAEYLAAVERGDLRTAQMMVNNTAKKSGIPSVGVNINDSETPWTDMILSGEKTIETRSTPNNALAPLVGERIAMVRTGRGPATVVGYATVGEPVVYRSHKEFAADYKSHRVRGGKFDWAGYKVGYPMLDVERITPYPAPDARGVIKTRPVHAAVELDQSNVVIPLSRRFSKRD